MNPNNLKKSEVKKDVTYFLCPDRTCRLFYDTSRPIPCESDCPLKEKLVKIIKCQACEELIELPGNSSIWIRIDHPCHGGEALASNFRMSGMYALIYKKPE